MKKYAALLTAVSAGALLLAQSTMNFHIGSLLDALNISDIDTIRFNNGVITVEGANKTYNVSNVDSATFTLAQAAAGDTVFVTYNGDNVVIDNPYPSISATADGANVTIKSAAATKGIVYCLSGTSTNGSFNLTPDKGFTLCLDNLNLSNSSAAPIALLESADGSSYAATVHLRGASTIADGSNSNYKGAIYSKSKLKISDDTLYTGTSLTVKGSYKHAINCAKHIELYSGKLNITGAPGDGINADGVEVYGGELAIAGVSGDGADCSEIVRIEGGTVNVDVTAEDAKGLKSDSVVNISGGEVTVNVSGSGSKAIKSTLATNVTGGIINATLSASDPFISSSDTSFNAALTSNGTINISDNAKVTVKGEGIAARALSADGRVNISGGTFNANLTGYYYIGNGDTTSVFGIKADTSTTISGGTVDIEIGANANIAKGIKADYVYVTGGDLTINNQGGYWYSTTSSSSSSSSSFGPGGNRGGMGGSSSGGSCTSTTPKCIRGDKLVSITGGTLNLTCAHGKGITSDESIVIGTKNGSDSDLTLTILSGVTSDPTFSSRASENTHTRYTSNPKAISCEKSVEINSGTLNLTAYDTGIQGYDVTVNGGKLTIEASMDQGIHGSSTLTVNDGDIYVSNSYEAFEAITITMNGGITSIYATDDGWNASVSGTGLSGTPIIIINGGYHYVNVGSGDTDLLDSNGNMKFTGGVLITEGGSTLDGNGSGTYTGGKLMLFGSGVETSPSGATQTTGSSISANTRYTVSSSDGTVLSSFTTSKSSNSLYYLYSSSVTMTSGGTYTASNNSVTVNFRWSNNSVLTYTEGGSVSGASSMSTSGGSSSGGWNQGGGNFGW